MRLWGVCLCRCTETLDKSATYLESNLLHFFRVICNACLCVCVCVRCECLQVYTCTVIKCMLTGIMLRNLEVNMYMYTMSNIS